MPIYLARMAYANIYVHVQASKVSYKNTQFPTQGEEIVDDNTLLDEPTLSQNGNQHNREAENQIGWIKSMKMKIILALAILLILSAAVSLPFFLPKESTDEPSTTKIPGTGKTAYLLRCNYSEPIHFGCIICLYIIIFYSMSYFEFSAAQTPTITSAATPTVPAGNL